jgi:hypothetical protein
MGFWEMTTAMSKTAFSFGDISAVNRGSLRGDSLRTSAGFGEVFRKAPACSLLKNESA